MIKSLVHELSIKKKLASIGEFRIYCLFNCLLTQISTVSSQSQGSNSMHLGM